MVCYLNVFVVDCRSLTYSLSGIVHISPSVYIDVHIIFYHNLSMLLNFLSM